MRPWSAVWLLAPVLSQADAPPMQAAVQTGTTQVANTQAQDWLSGEYRVLQGGKPDADAPTIQVRRSATHAGWQLGESGESIDLAPVPAADARKMLGAGVEDVQCAASSAHLLCHVRPGSALEGGFTSATGVFDVVIDIGPFELERIEPADAAPSR